MKTAKVENKSGKAAITGDFLHHPCQMEEPYWECSADGDRPMAQKTRVESLGKFADEELLVFGTHFASPSAGKVVRKGKHSQFEV